MSPLTCQLEMLSTRRDFSGDLRVYHCVLEKIAACIVGPEDDLTMLTELCQRCARYSRS